MKRGDFLFVYGTLRLGQNADLSRTGGALFAGPDRINGSLYALGWFPGVKLGELASQGFDPSKPAVIGELFLIEDESITAGIDRYEGHPNLFLRSEVLTESGKTAWVYEFQGDVSYAATPVPSGDWLEGER